MTFGFASLTDLLSWLAVLLLTAKVVATAILLPRPAADRMRTSAGRGLWWTTKLTSLAAILCLVAIAWLEHDRYNLAIYLVLLAFVAVAVPLAIARRHCGSLVHQTIAAAAPELRTPSPPSRPRR